MFQVMLSRNSSLWSAEVSIPSLWKHVVQYLSKVTLSGQELFSNFMWKQALFGKDALLLRIFWSCVFWVF